VQAQAAREGAVVIARSMHPVRLPGGATRCPRPSRRRALVIITNSPGTGSAESAASEWEPSAESEAQRTAFFQELRNYHAGLGLMTGGAVARSAGTTSLWMLAEDLCKGNACSIMSPGAVATSVAVNAGTNTVLSGAALEAGIIVGQAETLHTRLASGVASSRYGLAHQDRTKAQPGSVCRTPGRLGTAAGRFHYEHQ
jgi:hypothetical protein